MVAPLSRAELPPAQGETPRGGQSVDLPLRFTLTEAQQLALHRNWDLLAVGASVDAATAQKIVAHEFPNPAFSFSTTKIDIGHDASTASGNGYWDRSYDTIAAINQLLEIGGKRRHRQGSAQAGYEGARAAFLDAKRILDLAVAKAYIAAVFARENHRVLTNSAATLRAEARLAEIRFKAGEISAADKNQIEITAERFAVDAASAESTAVQAVIAFQVLLGISAPSTQLVLTDTLDLLSSGSVPGEPFFPDRRPDVVAAEAALRKAESDLGLQKANRIPDPTVLVQYEHEPPDTPNSIGLGVSLPIPLWNRNRGNIMSAEAVREQARLNLQKLNAQAAADHATATVAYEDAARRLQQYGQSIVPKSQEVRKTIAYAYQKGGASLLDLLIAERNDNEVRLATAQAASDVAASLASLRAASVQMEPASLNSKK